MNAWASPSSGVRAQSLAYTPDKEKAEENSTDSSAQGYPSWHVLLWKPVVAYGIILFVYPYVPCWASDIGEHE